MKAVTALDIHNLYIFILWFNLKINFDSLTLVRNFLFWNCLLKTEFINVVILQDFLIDKLWVHDEFDTYVEFNNDIAVIKVMRKNGRGMKWVVPWTFQKIFSWIYDEFYSELYWVFHELTMIFYHEYFMN